MSGISDNQLAQVRAQSEQAFQQMQRDADKAHADFLKRYGGNLQLNSPVQAPPQTSSSPVAPVRTKAAKPAAASKPPAGNKAEKLYESASTANLGAMSKESLDDSIQDVRQDLGKLSQNLREESRAAAREAMKGTKDILKGNASGLGAKAKEEATRLKDAMRQAMEEERSLKGMKGRAKAEAKKAKERFQSHVEEAKDDAVDSLKEMAQGSLEALKGKAMGAFEQGQDAVEREWKDFTTGQDSN
jgi:ElaB/YqjD/DUF883 family membrane-anchored ribosome-binding protein